MSRDSSALSSAFDAAPEEIPPQLRAGAILDHPRLPVAMQVHAARMIALHSRSRFIGWFLNDRVLTILALAAVCLAADLDDADVHSGLTPGRFRAFCIQQRMCSEGRAAAVLAFLRLSGHVEAATHPADRRITQLKPTAKLLDATRTRLQAQFEAVTIVCPEIAAARERLGEPDFDRRFYAELRRQFLAGARILERAPAVRFFADRDVGVIILFALMLGAGETDPLPPRGPVPLSINALAKQFRVSRTHVMRLIRDAEAKGLLQRTGGRGDQVLFGAELRESLRNMFASMFQMTAGAAWRVLQAS